MSEGFEPVEQTMMMQQLLTALQTLSSKMDSFTSGQFGHSNKFLQEISTSTVNAMDTVTSASMDHLKKYFNEIEKITESTSKNATQHLSAVFRNIDIMNDKAAKSNGTGSGVDLTNLMGKFKGVAAEISALAVQVAPQVAVFGALTATMVQMDMQTSSLLKTMGGNKQKLSEFTDMIGGVGASAKLSSGQVIELGKAFQQEGIFLTNHTPELREYLKTTGEATKMLDLSAGSATQFTKNLILMGKGSKEVTGAYDDMYRTMQKFQLTTDDLADSIMTANHLFSQFSLVSGQGVQGLAKELLATKSLLKSLGEDGKQAGNMLAAELGNVQLRTQHAGYISALLGGDLASNFNKLGTAQGEQMKRVAALTGVQNLVGSGLLYADPSQLSQNQQMNRTVRIGGAVDSISQSLGVNPGDLQRELSEYAIERQKNPGLSIQGFFENKAKSQLSSDPSKSWQEANASVNSSFGQLGKNFQHLMENIMIILGGPLMKILNPLLEGLNFLLDSFIEFTQKNPVAKAIADFIVAGVALGALLGPLRLVVGAVKIAAGVFPSLARGAALLSGMFKGFTPGGIGSFLNPTNITMIAVPLIALYFNKLEDFVTNFIPRWIKSLLDGFANSDAGKGITSFVGDVGKKISDFFDHPGQSISNWFMPPAAAATLPSTTMQGIQDVVKNGTAPGTMRLFGGTDYQDTANPLGATKMTPHLSKIASRFHPHMLANARIVAEEARRAGADQATMIATMLLESGGKEFASGDRGYFSGKRFIPDKNAPATSFGLFQLHKGGRLGNLTPAQAFDPRTNAARQASEFAKYHKSHPHFSPGQLAAFTQGPADKFHYAKAVDGYMPMANEILNSMTGGSISNVANLKTPDVSWYRKQQGGIGGSHPEEQTKLLKKIDDKLNVQNQKLDRSHEYKERRDKEVKRTLQSGSNGSLGEAAYLQNRLRNNAT